MTFTDTQTRALSAKLPERHIRTRVHNGEQRHYVEGWHVIAEANRIFGYDAWDRQTIELKSLGQTTVDYRFISTYLARVRITVRAGSVAIVREGVTASLRTLIRNVGRRSKLLKRSQTRE